MAAIRAPAPTAAPSTCAIIVAHDDENTGFVADAIPGVACWTVDQDV
jgi:hypothetical protein